MLVMENAEEVMQILERFTKLKQKDIPKELEEYLSYVAKTGDTVYTWAHIKYLFREKLMHVIKDFHDSTSSVDDLPQYPNVDPFNYETMKSALLERLELFNSAPFTVQRLCELLTDPKKQYSRIDKYMRALEKNILVVSTIEPGRKQAESENGDSLDSVVNGDLSLDVNIDVEIDIANEAFFSMQHQIRNNNATSSTMNNLNSNNKPVEDQDVEMPTAKKQKLDLELTPVTVKSPSSAIGVSVAETISIPSSEIPKQKPEIENEAVSDDSDSPDSKENIKKVDEKPKTEAETQQTTNNSETKPETVEKVEKIDDKIPTVEKVTAKLQSDEKKEIDSIPKITETISADKIDSVETVKVIMPDEKIETKKVVEQETAHDNSTPTAEDEEKLLNVDEEPEKKIVEKLIETSSKPSINSNEIVKDADKLIKDDIATTLKESAAADEKFEEEIEKIEADELPVIPDDNIENLPEISIEKKTEEETIKKDIVLSSAINEDLAEIYPHSAGNKITDQSKISERMSVEDITLTLVNPVPVPVPVPTPINVNLATTVEPIITDSPIFNSTDVVKLPEPVIPLDVDIVVADTISETNATDFQTDQPMEDNSIVDTAMTTFPANDSELTSVGEINEVVMQPAETEMATDGGELISGVKSDDKPDLTGMDIDDTSQEEAMDQ